MPGRALQYPDEDWRRWSLHVATRMGELPYKSMKDHATQTGVAWRMLWEARNAGGTGTPTFTEYSLLKVDRALKWKPGTSKAILDDPAAGPAPLPVPSAGDLWAIAPGWVRDHQDNPYVRSTWELPGDVMNVEEKLGAIRIYLRNRGLLGTSRTGNRKRA